MIAFNAVIFFLYHVSSKEFNKFLKILSHRFGIKIDEPSGVKRNRPVKDQEDRPTMLIHSLVRENQFQLMNLKNGRSIGERNGYRNSWSGNSVSWP